MGTAIITNQGLASRVAAVQPPTKPIGTEAVGAPAATPGVVPDEFLDRLIKLIPAEVVTMYTVLCAYVTRDGLRKAAYFVGIALTVAIVARPSKLPDGTRVRAPWQQYALSTLAFALWGTLINHPLDSWFVVDPEITGFIAIVLTFVSPFLIAA